MGCHKINRERKEVRMIPKKTYLHELPYTEIVKSGTIRLTRGQVLKHQKTCSKYVILSHSINCSVLFSWPLSTYFELMIAWGLFQGFNL